MTLETLINHGLTLDEAEIFLEAWGEEEKER